ncbi:MAG: hypothetical protein KKF46_06165 [Nanoarchaeota archaeon]|nr:hypothetical protein [Nanoarchaeota archaeon]MBU1321918.1 hypothetical protein [Nanoarchaeota archaeon]MBU1597611.1 hypothetical protein [Nanoarchaeota archaeon]MBU2440979.1 hypothetical protein [Nanoarchaeota archaeon]
MTLKKLKSKIIISSIAILVSLLGTGCNDITKLEHLAEDAITNNTKTTNFVLDICKTKSGKYYNQLIMGYVTSRPRGSGSTRSSYFNLDENPDTIEQYIKYVPSPNPRMWIPKLNIVSPGFKPYSSVGPNSEIRDMTPEEQNKINQEFQYERQFFETDPVLQKKGYRK